jgi:hypothetical protein
LIQNKTKKKQLFSYCHVTVKSEAIAPCKEMPVIPVDKVVGKKRISGKRGREGGKAQGGPKMWATFVIFKQLPEASNHPMGENP